MFRLEGLLDRVISPAPLLVGVAVGLVACALAGREAGRVNQFKKFDRFTLHTDYRTNYLVSANQVRSLMRAKVRPDQIAVIVGGNSVLLGCGQGQEGAWTRALQAELGDQYCVINLALPGLGLQEFGTLAAEMLYKDGHQRIIVLTNTWLHPTTPLGEPDGRPIIQWFYWDASARGLLLDFPEREARLAQPVENRTDGAKDRRQRDELIRQTTVDSWLNFRDLWNAFEYRYRVTVWCKPQAKSWSQARRKYPDPDPVVPAATPAFLEQIKPQAMPPLENAVKAFRSVFRRPSGELIPAAELGGPFPSEEALRFVYPPPVRERLIVVANRVNPYFLNLLPPDDRVTYDALGPGMAAIYGRAGVSVFEVGRGYPPDAFYDHVHLTAAGGRRLATDLAPVIRSHAAKLGY